MLNSLISILLACMALLYPSYSMSEQTNISIRYDVVDILRNSKNANLGVGYMNSISIKNKKEVEYIASVINNCLADDIKDNYSDSDIESLIIIRIDDRLLNKIVASTLACTTKNYQKLIEILSDSMGVQLESGDSPNLKDMLMGINNAKREDKLEIFYAYAEMIRLGLYQSNVQKYPYKRVEGLNERSTLFNQCYISKDGNDIKLLIDKYSMSIRSFCSCRVDRYIKALNQSDMKAIDNNKDLGAFIKYVGAKTYTPCVISTLGTKKGFSAISYAGCVGAAQNYTLDVKNIDKVCSCVSNTIESELENITISDNLNIDELFPSFKTMYKQVMNKCSGISNIFKSESKVPADGYADRKSGDSCTQHYQCSIGLRCDAGKCVPRESSNELYIPVKTDTPAKADAPAKIDTSSKTATPVKVATPQKTGAQTPKQFFTTTNKEGESCSQYSQCSYGLMCKSGICVEINVPTR